MSTGDLRVSLSPAKKFKEGKPKPEFLLSPGEYFLSAGFSIVYECLSYPFCRIYWEYRDDPSHSKYIKNWGVSSDNKQVYPTPHAFENSWYPSKDTKGNEKWSKRGPNYPSYLVRTVTVVESSQEVEFQELSRPFELTLRWAPTKSRDYFSLVLQSEELKKTRVDLSKENQLPEFEHYIQHLEPEIQKTVTRNLILK
jgi:hypothetical protein